MTYLLAGDSTVATYPPEKYPMSGWGGHLHEFVDEPVLNFAIRGESTRSFAESGTWAQVLAATGRDDALLIQFGHNDQKDPGVLASRGGFREWLLSFVEDVRAAGARPVLLTPPERRWFDGARVVPTHGDYPNAVRDVAAQEQLSLIDLTVFTTWLFEDRGPGLSRDLVSQFRPGEFQAWPDGLTDDTHFSIDGARAIARFVALSLRAIERRDGDGEAMGLRLMTESNEASTESKSS